MPIKMAIIAITTRPPATPSSSSSRNSSFTGLLHWPRLIIALHVGDEVSLYTLQLLVAVMAITKCSIGAEGEKRATKRATKARDKNA